MTNCCEELKWKKMTRDVYHKGLNKMVKLPFYRLNTVDEYNNHMNNVDIADQIRGSYCFDWWMRKQKWWWSMLFWTFQMGLTNAYILYKKYMKMHDSKVMSHYEFQKKVALAWINQKKSWPQLKKNIVVNHNNIDAMLEFAANTTTASSEQSISISSLGLPEMPPIIQCMKAPPFNEKTLDPKKGVRESEARYISASLAT